MIPAGLLAKPAVKIGLGVAAVLFVLGGAFTAGFWVNGAFKDAEIAGLKLQHSNDALEAEREATRRADVQMIAHNKAVAQLAAIDAERTAALKGAQDENNRLRGAVDAGVVSLRVVGARCPAAGKAAPHSASGSGVGTGEAPTLNASAGSAYFALRDGLNRQREQIITLQDSIAVYRQQCGGVIETSAGGD